MPYGIANKMGRVKQLEIASILNLAWESGVESMDTAKKYGSSEEVIGAYLKRYPEQSWKICTKVSDHMDSLVEQHQDSIRKLSCSPTILLAHSSKLYLDEKFYLELQKLKEEKLIDKIGVSLYSDMEINDVMISRLKPDVIQLPLNILDTRLYLSNILQQLGQDGIEIHVRSAFLQGLFYLSSRELKYRFSDVVPYLNKLKSIAADSGLTLAELSLLWLTSLSEVSKVVIGVDKASHLKTHLQTLGKQANSSIFDEALAVQYKNENILNPSLWPK